MSVLILSFFIGVVYYMVVRKMDKTWILMLLLFVLPMVSTIHYTANAIDNYEWMLSSINYNNFYSLLIALPIILPLFVITIAVYIFSFVVLCFSYFIAKRVNKKKDSSLI